MTHFLRFPDAATWEALAADWQAEEIDASIWRGPQGQTAKVVGQNYWLNEEGEREPRDGFLVNINHTLPESMAKYEGVRPSNPKDVFLGG